MSIVRSAFREGYFVAENGGYYEWLSAWEDSELKKEEQLMSLTRKEWEELWKMTQRLEWYLHDVPPHIGFKKFAKKYIRFIKDKIQQVIGQME